MDASTSTFNAENLPNSAARLQPVAPATMAKCIRLVSSVPFQRLANFRASASCRDWHIFYRENRKREIRAFDCRKSTFVSTVDMHRCNRSRNLPSHPTGLFLAPGTPLAASLHLRSLLHIFSIFFICTHPSHFFRPDSG